MKITTGYTVPEQIPATLTIQPDIEYQKVQGFGVMETSWQQTALTEEEMNTLFGTGADQLGCNILRIRIAPKDKNQTADSRWGTVARVAKVAKDLGTTILATPWTPPVSLKTLIILWMVNWLIMLDMLNIERVPYLYETTGRCG